MTVKDILLAKNTNVGIRRLCVVISLAMVVIWTLMNFTEFDDVFYFEVADWLTYAIGLAVALVGPTLAFGLYWALPPLGKTRRGDLVVVALISLILCGMIYTNATVRTQGTRTTPLEEILNNLDEIAPPFLLILGICLVALKVLLWVWQGFRRPTAN